MHEPLISDEAEEQLVRTVSTRLPTFAINAIRAMYEEYKKCDHLEIYGGRAEINNLECLLEGHSLREGTVNAYFRMLRHEFAQCGYMVLESYAAGRPFPDKKTKLPVVGPALMPICHSNHWILALVNTATSKIHIWNSLEAGRGAAYYQKPNGYLKGVLHWFKEAYEVDIKDYTIIVEQSEQQTDGVSCGVFVMLRAKAILSRTPFRMFSQARAQDIRDMCFWELLYGPLN